MPESESIETVTTPSGSANGFGFAYWRSVMARFVNSVRTGRADFAPFDFELSVIVEADPDDAQQVRGEPGEPAIRWDRCRFCPQPER